MPTEGPTRERVRQVTDLSVGTAYAAATRLGHAATGIKGLARESVTQLPRLRRLQGLRPSTGISLGRLLDEAAKRSPDEIVYLFGDRAIRHREFKHRVDSIVKGLLSVGVRQGERVGVLMSTRPSCFSVVAAISRLGATAVMLRPSGDVRREAR